MRKLVHVYRYVAGVFTNCQIQQAMCKSHLEKHHVSAYEKKKKIPSRSKMFQGYARKTKTSQRQPNPDAKQQRSPILVAAPKISDHFPRCSEENTRQCYFPVLTSCVIFTSLELPRSITHVVITRLCAWSESLLMPNRQPCSSLIHAPAIYSTSWS